MTVSLATCLSVAALADDSAKAVVKDSSQVWLINTRSAPRCGDLECGLSQITYSRGESVCDDGSIGHWQSADEAAFAASGDPNVPTIVLVHGNGTDECWAVRHGATLNCRLKSCANGRPYRLVIWSWPADRAALRPRNDVQIKVEYSETESYYLARVLPSIKSATPTCLIGFSLGTRTVSGALELLSGNAFAGRCLPADKLALWQAGPPRPMRVMLIAAAMETDILGPCGAARHATASVEKLFVSRNESDRVLKYYDRLYGRGGPDAMGFAGPGGPCDKFEVVDVTNQVGPRHDFDRYFAAGSFVGRLCWYSFLTAD